MTQTPTPASSLTILIVDDEDNIRTAFASIETTVEAMRRGVNDYIPKLFSPEQIRLLTQRQLMVSEGRLS